MTWAGPPWAGATWAGVRELPAAGGGIITDPARPDAPGYRWAAQAGGGAWAVVPWAGGGAVVTSARGGLLVEPDADSALVRIDAWWSGAPYLRLARLVGDDTAPVRTAYPVPVRTPTRRNECTNPSFETATTGWVAAANTAVTAIADAAAPAGSRVGRLTAAAAGTVGSSVPCALDTARPTGISLALRLSAAPSGALTVTATWLVATGATDGSTTTTTTTATLSAAALAGHVGAFARTPVLTIAPPPSGVLQGSLALSVAGLPAGATADLDAVLVETGDTGGAYFDGADTTGTWAGTAHLSASTLAATLQIIDREAPLDVPVRYELTAPDQPTYRALSEPVVLESRGRTWLTHPAVGLPTVVHVAREPEQTYAIARGVFRVLGRARPVVVTGGIRHAPSGTHQLYTETFGERDALLALLADGQPLLLRAPAELGHGPGEWIAVGDVTVAAVRSDALEGARSLQLPFDVVDAPAVEAA